MSSFENFKQDLIESIKTQRENGVILIHSGNYVNTPEGACGQCALRMLYECKGPGGDVDFVTVCDWAVDTYNLNCLGLFNSGFDHNQDNPPSLRENSFSRYREDQILAYDLGLQLRSEFQAISKQHFINIYTSLKKVLNA